MSRWKVCMTKVTTSAVASIMFNLRKSHTQSTDDTMPKVSFKCLSIPFLPLISTAQWGEIIFEGELEIFSYAFFLTRSFINFYTVYCIRHSEKVSVSSQFTEDI